jgi:hypothetical protein
MSPRRRPLMIAAAAVAVVWLLAFGGYATARAMKVTPEKVRAYIHSVDFAKLSGPARLAALKKLAAMLNALSLQERQSARLDAEWGRWMEAMNDDEKGVFMESTLPTGFKQMMVAFEEMPLEKRRKAVNDSVRRLREARQRRLEEAKNGDDPQPADTNAPPPLSPELQEKAVQLGLKTFYDTGSATMKVELAPLLEEMQQDMADGQLFGRPRSKPHAHPDGP